MDNYYQNELNQVNTESSFAPKMKVWSGEGHGATKTLDINKESAQVLVEWLTENFITKTQVMFRFWRGEVIALFPYLLWNHKGNVTSYMHVGQHGEADYYGIIRGSKPATEDQYKDLFQELESIGYNLEIVKKRNYNKFVKELKEIRK